MIKQQSAQKFALDAVVVDCVGNGLKDAIWRDDGELSKWVYRCHPKVIVDRNQTKSKLDFNWDKNQNKPQRDLFGPGRMSMGKNQDKPLRDLN